MAAQQPVGIEEPKRSKASVDYSDGMPRARCGICEYFVPTGKCELVAGLIDPMMWCRLFEKR